jgi:uncharacterized protein (TIGR03083 family)
MTRPTTKTQLLEAMTTERHRLESLLQTLTPDQMTQAGACGEWSVKDVLAHLLAWEHMVVGWYQAGARGETVKTPATDLKWSETPILNRRIYERYKDVPLNEIQAQFAASYVTTRTVLESIPEAELVTPHTYAWTNTSTLLSYFVSCTASHYHWAYDEIRKWLKALPRAV